MNILRTPEQHFSAIRDFPWTPCCAQLGQLRMHDVEDGPSDGARVLMLHGEPTWSSLHRKTMRVSAATGYRAIAPDLIGFGRSDKPADIGDYSDQRHVDRVLHLIEALDWRNIRLVCQDWRSPRTTRRSRTIPARPVHAFPRRVPTETDDPAASANRAACQALGRFQKPFLTVFGELDPILGNADTVPQNHVPGAKGQLHARLRAGHFLQEDQGAEWARRVAEGMRT